MLVSHNIVTDLNNITSVFQDFQSSPNTDAKLFHNTDAKKQRAKEQPITISNTQSHGGNKLTRP